MGAVSFINSLPEDAPGNFSSPQSLFSATSPSKSVISRVGTTISAFHVGEESVEPITGGTSGQQNGLTPQTLGEDAKRLLQKTSDAVSKPLNALWRIFSEAVDDSEDQLRLLDGEQFETPLHQTEGQTQTPYKPRVKRVSSPMTPPSGSGPKLSVSPSMEADLRDFFEACKTRGRDGQGEKAREFSNELDKVRHAEKHNANSSHPKFRHLTTQIFRRKNGSDTCRPCKSCAVPLTIFRPRFYSHKNP